MDFFEDLNAEERAEQWCQRGKELWEREQWQESHQCFLQSIRLNSQHGESLFRISRVYWEGLGVERDVEKSIYWLRKAAECGFAEAENDLGSRYHNGECIPQDYDQAFFWYYHAAQNGNRLGEYNLGDAYYNGKGVGKNHAVAFWWYSKAAEKGDLDAQYCLWRAFFHGHGTEQDHELAAKWLEKSAVQGLALAQYNLGISYEYGYGVQANNSAAISWYTKAAKQGDVLAIKALDRFEAVLFLVGSYCTGKSTLSKARPLSGIRIIVEVSPGEMANAAKNIRQALDSGRRVILEALLCDNPGELVERMLFRARAAESTEELVIVHPIDDMAHSYLAVPEAVQELDRQFRDIVELVTVDNSGELKNAAFHVGTNPSPLVQKLVLAQHKHLQTVIVPLR